MLLRRISEHVRDQNWVAVGIDFAIVVIGVFIGIQVANWNAARIENQLEQSYLIRLHEDITESLVGQERDIRFLTQQLSDQAIILTSLKQCAVAADDDLAFQRGLNTLGYINPPRLIRTTIDELASTGRSDLLKSREVRERLADVVALEAWRGSSFDTVSRLVEYHRLKFVSEIIFNLDETFPDPFLGSFSGVEYEIDRLCQDRSLASSVSAVSLGTVDRKRAYAAFQDSMMLILPAIESELKRRWDVELAQTDLN
jgi:hypothetical protein